MILNLIGSKEMLNNKMERIKRNEKTRVLQTIVKRREISMSENVDSPRYLGEVMEKFLLASFKDIIEIEKLRGSGIETPVDWIYNIDNKKIKIKQLSSSLKIVRRENNNRIYFQWNIRQNDVPDIFIVSGWSNVQNSQPLYVWAIGSHEIVNCREFWDRQSFIISNHSRSLKKYSKFLISKEGLDNAQKYLKKRFREIENE